MRERRGKKRKETMRSMDGKKRKEKRNKEEQETKVRDEKVGIE